MTRRAAPRPSGRRSSPDGAPTPDPAATPDATLTPELAATRDAGPSRSSLSRSLAIAWVLAVKDLKVDASYRLSFIVGHATVVFSVVVFYFVSRVVSPGGAVGAPDEYFRFLVVGLAVGALIEQTVRAAIDAARRDQVQGTLEAIASLPVGPLALGAGWVLYPTLDCVLSIAIMVCAALPLGLWGADPSVGPLVVAVVLTVVLFCGLGLIGAALVVAFQQGAGALTLGLSALAVISGGLFPTTVMPEWLQAIASVSPLKHALDAVRATGVDGAGFAEAGGSLLALAAFAVVVVPAGAAALSAGLVFARRRGTLGKY
jgi:ABC-2 type transport system permease protein